MRNRIGAAALISASVFALPAAAERPSDPAFSVTVGFAPVFGPLYQGADDYGLSIYPDIRIAWGERFSASVPDGMRFNVVDGPDFKAGPIARIRFGRDATKGASPFLIVGETQDLLGLEDISAAAELGGFADYARGQLRLRGELRRGFGGHEGIAADFSAAIARRDGGVSWSFGPRATIGGARYVDAYFGIDPAGAAGSGLPTFEARGGVVSYGVGGAAVYAITDSVAVTVFGGYDRLGGDAARSPLVDLRGDQDQVSVGLAFGYRFGWGRATRPAGD